MAKFKTRARALDLLGRQQIAGIPTAICELIKNAHDAYADHIDIDYLRPSETLILRDDGMGMTRDDFESRWLTLGTESKFEAHSLPPKDPTKPNRDITGEKGIGRLAIASIGPQVLVLTKAKKKPSACNIVAAYINWQLFELPGLNIEDITIPIREFFTIPTAEDVEALKLELLKSLELLHNQTKIDTRRYQELKESISAFRVNPSELNQNLPSTFDLNKEDSGGTQFFISPVNSIINDDIDGDKNDPMKATKIEKMLVGFHNTMTPGHPTPQLKITFRDHKKDDGTYDDLIAEEQFFTPEEFEKADHHFMGKFDEFGSFKGKVKIYDSEPKDYSIIWNNNSRQTECGPFYINLAYLQGEQKSSKVNSVDYAVLKAKSDRFGGLYIYRNNIRVLPYGDSDYDFLDIEKNRSKRAATYFFSYRRMFGVIEIADRHNSRLIEKAGREGFIENKAYKQLQSILKNFFVQLAADFFSSGGDKTFVEKRDQFKLMRKALDKHDEMVREKKQKFLKKLELFFKNLTNKVYEKQIHQIIKAFHIALLGLNNQSDKHERYQNALSLELDVRKKLRRVRQNMALDQPKGFALSKEERLDFITYEEEFRQFDEKVITTAENEIDQTLEKWLASNKYELNRNLRLKRIIEELIEEGTARNNEKLQEVVDTISGFDQRIRELIEIISKNWNTSITKIKQELTNQLTENLTCSSFEKNRQKLEVSIEKLCYVNEQITDSILRQYENFYFVKAPSGEIVTSDQIAEAVSEELEDLKRRVQADVELSQLGLAVNIVHHEFNSTINSIRRSIRDLKPWADTNSNILAVYKNIKINFEHLDGYLNLFTPLNRRLNRYKEHIKLTDIYAFLQDLFGARLERERIQLKRTAGFEQSELYGFRSSFYPVFVNLVDNAIYWLSTSNQSEKIIRLHADEKGVYVSNNGPEIPIQDRERIFELRFTRKPFGRGLGLSISKEVLRSAGYDIQLVEPRQGSTVTFIIQRYEE